MLAFKDLKPIVKLLTLTELKIASLLRVYFESDLYVIGIVDVKQKANSLLNLNLNSNQILSNQIKSFISIMQDKHRHIIKCTG